MATIEDFLRDIDGRWKPSGAARISLQLIGCAALMLQSDYDRGTKDSDVLETSDLSEHTKAQLLRLAGKGTELHRRHKLYIDIVSGGVPFLPQGPRWIRLELHPPLSHFDAAFLDVVDVVVSKLKRFSANDRSDIAAMIERDLVPHDLLVSRFSSAVKWFEMDARAPQELPKYIRNLNQIERDELGVPETQIELPSWL
jgi:hypothetical protein